LKVHHVQLGCDFSRGSAHCGVIGLSGIAGMATQFAWILFVVGLVLAVVFFLMGRRPPL
jgi:uncharacterized membrane protein YtjA (UPF0391 family)